MANQGDIWNAETLDSLRADGLGVLRPYGEFIKWEDPYILTEYVGDEITLGSVSISHVGDVLCMSALPRLLKEKYGCKVYVTRNNTTRSVFKNNPYVDGLRKSDVEREWTGKSKFGDGHIIQQLAAKYGLPVPEDPRPEIYLSAGERKWAAEILSAAGEKPILIFSPGCVSRADWATFPEWPWQKWIDRLRETFFVVEPRIRSREKYAENTNEENAYKNAFIRQAEVEVDLAIDNLPTRKYFSLFSAASAYFGTNSAGSHVAAALGVPALVAIDRSSGVPPVNFHMTKRLRDWVYPYQNLALFRVKYEFTRSDVFLGMKRSGHHAVINWFCSQQNENVLFHNEGLDWNMLTPRWSRRYENATGGPIRKVYNVEDFDFRRFGHYKKKAGGGRMILVIRDLRNWVADCIAKRDDPNAGIMIHVFANLRQRAKLWEQQARASINTPDSVSVILFDRWFCDPDYRRELADRYGFRFSDAGLNEVVGNGGGDSFDGREYNGRGQQMDVLNRWKIYKDDPAYKEIVTPRRARLNKRMLEALGYEYDGDEIPPDPE